jgi:type IV pilus assembly protein PilM
MIQDVFLPRHIGDYYIFSQKVVGIDITKSHIHATVLRTHGTTIVVDKMMVEPVAGDAQNYVARVAEKLTAVMNAIGKVDHIRTAISSSYVVFKELRLPFADREKINLVIRFEVEPLLPFPAQEAVIDFIITEVNTQEQSAQVLVAATQKQHIEQHLALFTQAGIHPTAITVDMFALYALYTQIPTYMNLAESVLLIDLDMQNTRIMAIDNHQLRVIRTLPHGFATVTKEATTAKPAELMEHLIRFGISGDGKSEKNQTVATNLTSYFNKIQFAITSTATLLQHPTISKILLTGAGAEIKDIATFAQNQLQLPCEIFNEQLLAENKRYTLSKNIHPSPANVLSLATALMTPTTEHLNLEKE